MTHAERYSLIAIRSLLRAVSGYNETNGTGTWAYFSGAGHIDIGPDEFNLIYINTHTQNNKSNPGNWLLLNVLMTKGYG